MRALHKIATLFLLALILGGSDKQIGLISGDVGKEYIVVRRNLLRNGNTPISQISDYRNQNCAGNEVACKIYPELIACAVDEQNPCRFEWKSREGQRFYVVTTGEDAHHLIVQGIGFDMKPGSSFYSVED